MIWKSIKGYSDKYEISDTGEIKNIKTLRTLKQKKDKRGAKYICLSKNNIKKTFLVHRLVLESFYKKPTKKEYTVNHKDGNPSNNKINNLEWSSNKNNTQHALKNGLIKNLGENCHLAKMNRKKVYEIKRLFETKKITQKKIGNIYGIHQTTVSKIIRNKIWKIYG